ncbi:hypothetical protein QQS21_001392 [Conoideocrella luteorostrata]|uniref:Zn(2)-C6 fungal-type domain-containing protein n=1 Tax=Conoideocrella luteorostrata TaxID=1105319 RepID=A0AAJ0CZX9_9HYPO|nr:hypothetical protein QQS21_001392 [Conoideocrella luteorostrata]
MENTTDAETIMETGRDNPIVENAGADGVGAVDAAVAAVAADTRHPPAHPAAEQRHTPLPDSRRGPGRPSIAAGDTGCMPPSGPQQEPQPARKHPAGPTRSRPKGPVNGVRKFIIESTFGLPRVRGSRKSRPCDVCRHRKIACVIATEPPCDFCRSRDLECTGVLGLKYGLNIDSGVPLHGSELATAPEALPQHRLVDVCDGLSVKPSVKPPENVAAKPPPRQTVETTVMPPTSPADDETEVHLDNCEGQSIYYIGPGAEQDSLLLDSFRYPILNDCPLARCKIVPVHPGGESSTDRPVNFLLLNRTQSEAASLSKKNSLEVIEGNAFPYGPILVRLYFAHIHPAFPILPKSRFLRSYSTDRESIPSSLRGAVYAVASTFWAHDKSLPGRCPIQQHAMLDLAHSALRREIESPSLFIVAACLLIIHGTSGKAENIETPATWTLAAQATAAAQMIGLHQDPGRWKIPSDEKRLRRKLWWACYATDCFSSMAFGNPPHIGAGGWSTLEPSLEDLRCDEDVPSNLEHLIEGENTRFDVTTGARFLELVKISKYMREILDSNLLVPSIHPKSLNNAGTPR